MKKIFNKTFLHRTLGISLCFTALSCLCVANVYAQDEYEEEEVAAVKKVAKEKKEKTYEMKEVKGRVIEDATGDPMGGVRIQALGLEKYSTLTEEDGTYKLSIPVFSDAVYVYAEGYNPLQVAVKDGVADANLIPADFNGSFTDGTTIISQKKVYVDESSSVSVDQDIERLLAGDVHTVLRNGLPGIGSYMTIRGVNSINANAQPLIILDGNMIDSQYDRVTMHEGFYNNLLAGIDPENIESVQVIKNGTALYGAKGGNGVIIIKTKRGKSMATKIGVRIYGGVELAPNKISMLDGNQYSSYLSDMVSTIKNMSANSLSQYAFLDKSPSNYYRNVFNNNTDWQKDLYRAAMTQNYKINVEGGDDIGMYALSLGYTKANSTGKNNDFSRLNLRFNTDIQVFSKVRTELDIAYNQVSYDIIDNGWSEDYSMQNIGSTNVLGLIQAPFISPYAYYYNDIAKAQDQANGIYKPSSEYLHLSSDYAGKYASKGGTWVNNPFRFPLSLGDNGINEALRNPYWILENTPGENKNYAQCTQIDLNVHPTYQVTKTFSISDRFNFLMTRNSEKYFLPVNGTTNYFLQDLGYINAVQKTLFSKETTLQNDLRLDWHNIYGAHTIGVFGGWRYNNYSYSYNYMRGYNNENDKLPVMNKNMAYLNYGGTNDNWIDMAYYLDANYNYANRYFAEAAVSMQSSSRFGRDTKQGIKLAGVSWGIFPSVQLGWIITNEKWFPYSHGAVNYLKLTAGFDQSGNDDLDYYASRTYWESMKHTNNTVALYLNNIENSAIQWETTTRWNVALQGVFLKNRLTAGFDLYWNKTSNLLTVSELPYMSGMSRYWTNEGALTNRGFEFSFNAALINNKNWKWELGASLGHYNNKITELPESSIYYIKQKNESGGYDVIHGRADNVYGEENVLTAVGYAVGSFWGWQTDGVFASDAEASTAGKLGYLKYPSGLKDESKKYYDFKAGDVRFVDRNNDGIIDESDKTVIGNPNPDIYGNLFTSLTWKNLRLDVNFKYSVGNDIYNYQRSEIEGLNTTYNQTTAALRRWTYEGQNTDMPRACYTDSEEWRNNERMSDRWIEDGSYLKLKNVRLTYKIPYTNSWLLGLKVWGEANNLFTVTRYLGLDPEMSSRNNSLYQGVDTGLIPNGRSFNVGVSINL
ncbi:MAG: SusC/RagA family TonB-linked outer membrane protein [Bacteroidaceae bacterium]|nr:SusC/RagA family TonB-linked outer membrane protein [Bacteroidaceae bacterium]